MVIRMDCVFCKIANGEIPSKTVYEDDKVLAFMDINPHAKGHVLIVPKKHYEDFTQANDIISHMFEVANKVGNNILDKLEQKGFSLVINYGDAQEVKHLHLHIIPTNHDTNYDLDDVHKKIKM